MSDPVLELLKSKNIPFTVSGRDYLTKCFNPDHEDKSPSFRIDKLTGVCHCFSCGFKANIFKHFGLLTNNVSVKIVKLKEKLRLLQESTNGLEPLEGSKPINETFRGISVKTLKEFRAFKTDKVSELEDRIIFPIVDVRNKTVAYIGRHILSNGNPRYIIQPAGANIPMFPANFKERYSSIILVEGIFDMLNLYDKGLHNVVCTFGTSRLFNDTADKLLSYKVIGIEKVFILYDGDEPGKQAAIKIKPLIEEAGFIVEIIHLEDDTDPGDLDQEYVDNLIEYIK